MILVEKTLGNLGEPVWHDRSHHAKVDLLVLEQWEAPKSRLRKASEGGVELAISLPRDQHLHDGDVLYYDEAAKHIVVARIALKEVLVIEMEGLEKLSPTEILRTCFELGHGLGNQHWPAVIKGNTVYVPLSVDQKVMASVMRTHAFQHVRTHFAPVRRSRRSWMRKRCGCCSQAPTPRRIITMATTRIPMTTITTMTITTIMTTITTIDR